MVTSYAENIKNNVESLTDHKVHFRNPFMAFTNEEILTKRLVEEFTKDQSIPEKEIRAAAHKAWQELIASRQDMEKKGEEVIAWLKETGHHGIVLAGRPYHVDPEINHGIPELITSYGFAVLTVPLPPLRGSFLCEDTAKPGSDPAQLLRMRSGRSYY